MAGKTKYTLKQLVRAQALRAQGYSYAFIANKVGFSDKGIAAYHLDPERRRKHHLLTEAWRKKHPDRSREIAKKAAKKWYKLHPEFRQTKRYRIKRCKQARNYQLRHIETYRAYQRDYHRRKREELAKS